MPNGRLLTRTNHFIPLITALAVSTGFVCYWTAIRFFHGFQAGYGVKVDFGNEQEMLGMGLTLLFSLLPGILWEGLDKLVQMWPVFLGALVIGVLLGLIFVKADNTKYAEPSQKVESKIMAVSGLAGRLWLPITTFLVFFIAIPQGAYQQALEHSQKKLNELIEQGCDIHAANHWMTCVSIEHDMPNFPHPLVGYLAHQDKQNIAIFLPQSRELKHLTLPANAVISRKLKASPGGDDE